MKKTWLIARTTYRERLRSGMFLLLTFGLPLLMIGAGFVGYLTASPDEGTVPETIGYVDQTGTLTGAREVTISEALLDLEEAISFTSYPTEGAAEAAYLAGEISGYLLIPADYFAGGAVSYFTDDEAGEIVEEGVTLFLQRSLLADQPGWLFDRLEDPTNYTYVGRASGEQIVEGPALIIRIVTPVFMAAVFVLAVLFGTSQMGAAVIREKDQRAMEMVITSLRPVELVGGKIMGMTLLSLTQFAIWAAGGVVALLLAFSDQIALSELVIPWSSLLWGALLIIPGYFLFAVLAAGLGIIAGDSQQAQQLAGIMSFIGLAPIYILGPILENPDGPLAVGLSLFPLTSPSVTLLRTTFAEVPGWQMGAALAILLGTLALAIWLVTRIFRAAMLNYGKALRPREIWQALAQAS